MYSSRFVDIYERVGGTVHIDDFANRVDPNKIGFGSKKNFYSPIQFHIQAGKNPHDVVRVQAYVHENEQNWMKELQTNLAACLGARMENAENIQLKTVTGKPLEKVPIGQLEAVGKLHMYVDNKLKQLPKLPETFPIEYSVTKTNELGKWIETKLLAEVIPVVTNQLAQIDRPEVFNQALAGDGFIREKVKQVVIGSEKNWAEFTRKFHANPNSFKIGNEVAVADLIADDILTMIRHYADATKRDISEHIQSKISFANVGKEHHFKPLLTVGNSVNTSSKEVVTAEGYNMYKRMVDGALKHPALVSSIFNSIHHYYEPKKVVPPAASLKPLRENTHHPWNNLIHHTILPIKGQYPVDYLKRHLKQDMSAKAKYVGTESRTYSMFHLFSGHHQAPPPRFIHPNPQYNISGIATAALIEKSSRFKRGGAKKGTPKGFDKGKKNEHYPFSSNKGMEDPAPQGLVDSEYVELIPLGDELIECRCPGNCLCDKKKKNRKNKKKNTSFMEAELPELVPLGEEFVESEMPELVPLGDELIECCGNKEKKKDKKKKSTSFMEAEMPELVPLGEEFVESEMPELVPLGDELIESCGNKDKKKKKKKNRMTFMEAEQTMDDEFADFPTVENVFKQTTTFY